MHKFYYFYRLIQKLEHCNRGIITTYNMFNSSIVRNVSLYKKTIERRFINVFTTSCQLRLEHGYDLTDVFLC